MMSHLQFTASAAPPRRGANDSGPFNDLEVTDRLLRERLRRGDLSAYETLVRTEAPGLLALVRPLLADEDESRDVTARALQLAGDDLPELLSGQTVSDWLRAVAIELSLNLLRNRCAWSDTVPEEWLASRGGASQTGGAAACAPMAASPSPSLRRQARRLIEALPDAYRAVLILRDRERLTTEEVARLIGEPPAAVRSRLHTARQALLQLMQPMLEMGSLAS